MSASCERAGEVHFDASAPLVSLHLVQPPAMCAAEPFNERQAIPMPGRRRHGAIPELGQSRTVVLDAQASLAINRIHAHAQLTTGEMGEHIAN